MANLPIQDQANAIWKALDDMLEKDPEGYKKYIEEQMKEAKSLKAKDPNASGTGAGGQGSSQSGIPSPLSLGLDMLLGQLGINTAKKGPTRPHEKSGDEKMPLKKVDSNMLRSAKAVINLSAGDNSGGNSLLDDNIGNSVIASIVTNKAVMGEEGSKEEDEEHEIHLVDIKLPSESNFKNDAKKGKPLIEEL